MYRSGAPGGRVLLLVDLFIATRHHARHAARALGSFVDARHLFDACRRLNIILLQVLVLLDTRNEAWDRIVSSFILEQRDQPADGAAASDDAEPVWPLEKLQVRHTLNQSDAPQPVIMKETGS